TKYYGNAYSNGFSNANVASDYDTDSNKYDDINNVECVYIEGSLSNPLQEGQYSVEVIAEQIQNDAISLTDTIDDQDFSLIISNVDRTPPVLDSFCLNNDDVNTNNQQIDIKFNLISEDLYEARFKEDDNPWDEWMDASDCVPGEIIHPYSLKNGYGKRTIYCEIKDYAGNVCPKPYSDYIYYDVDVPVIDSYSISDSEYVNTNIVDLHLYASDENGIKNVLIANENPDSLSPEDFSDNDHDNYNILIEDYELSDGDGLKTVYFQVKDYASRESNIEFDEITVDTVPPIISNLFINNGDISTKYESVNIRVEGYDDVGIASIYFSNNPNSWDYGIETSVLPYTGQWSLPSGDGDGLKTVYCKLEDLAGNVVQTSQTILLDSTAPAISSFVVSSLDGDTEITDLRNVELSLEASDSGSGVDEVRFINEDEYDGKWHTESSNLYIHNVLPGESQYIIITEPGALQMKIYFDYIDTRNGVDYVYVTDINGDNYGTYTGIHSNVLTDPIPGSYVKIEIVCRDIDVFGSDGFDVGEIYHYTSDWSGWFDYPLNEGFTWLLSEGYGDKTVHCQVKDMTGNIQSNDDSISYQSYVTSIIIADGVQYTDSKYVSLKILSDISLSSIILSNSPSATWQSSDNLNKNNPREEWWHNVDILPMLQPYSQANPYGSDIDESWYIEGPSSADAMKLRFPGIHLWEDPNFPSVFYDKLTLCDGTMPPDHVKYNTAYDTFTGDDNFLVTSEEVPSNVVRIRLDSRSTS
ncbi:MAG: hypothetical protein KAJ19_20960, partial [Gammaproteobacteria bacterium]|nr:hypothetical protein [Gammaproteobacteria bacterium]